MLLNKAINKASGETGLAKPKNIDTLRKDSSSKSKLYSRALLAELAKSNTESSLANSKADRMSPALLILIMLLTACSGPRAKRIGLGDSDSRHSLQSEKNQRPIANETFRILQRIKDRLDLDEHVDFIFTDTKELDDSLAHKLIKGGKELLPPLKAQKRSLVLSLSEEDRKELEARLDRFEELAANPEDPRFLELFKSLVEDIMTRQDNGVALDLDQDDYSKGNNSYKISDFRMRLELLKAKLSKLLEVYDGGDISKQDYDKKIRDLRLEVSEFAQSAQEARDPDFLGSPKAAAEDNPDEEDNLLPAERIYPRRKNFRTQLQAMLDARKAERERTEQALAEELKNRAPLIKIDYKASRNLVKSIDQALSKIKSSSQEGKSLRASLNSIRTSALAFSKKAAKLSEAIRGIPINELSERVIFVRSCCADFDDEITDISEQLQKRASSRLTLQGILNLMLKAQERLDRLLAEIRIYKPSDLKSS